MVTDLSQPPHSAPPDAVKSYLAEILLELTVMAARLGEAELTAAIGAAAMVAERRRAS